MSENQTLPSPTPPQGLTKAQRKAEKKRRKKEQQRIQQQQAREAAKLRFERQMQADRETLSGLSPAKRWQGLARNHSLQQWMSRNSSWPEGWQEAFSEWLSKKEEQKRRAKERRVQRNIAQALEMEIPSTKHFRVTRTEQAFEISLRLEDCNAGCQKMEQDLAQQILRHCFSRKCEARLLDSERRLEARFPRVEAKTCARALERAEAEIAEFQKALLPPYYVEALLNISPIERKRWTEAGLLRVHEYHTIHKPWVGDLRVPMYNPLVIRNISQSTIASWRDKETRRRETSREQAAVKAKITKKENDALRSEARKILEQRARNAAIFLGSPSVQPVYYLALLAAISPRHAKEAQLRGNNRDRELFYHLKGEAVSVLLQSPYARVAFVPAHEPKYEIDCCDMHFEQFREQRRWLGELRFLEWAFFYLPMLKKCGACKVYQDDLYYATYALSIGPETDEIVLHTPYPLGESLGFPEHTTLPRASHSSEGFSDCGFLFGHPSGKREKMLFTTSWLKNALQRSINAVRTQTESARAKIQ